MIRDKIKDLIGVPFKKGGRNPKDGLDCWGVVVEVYKRLGIQLPDYNHANEDPFNFKRLDNLFSLYAQENCWKRLEKPEFPCVVAIKTFGLVTHAGVYIGNGKFIHSLDKLGVIVSDLKDWKNKIEGYYRYEPEEN